MINAFILVFSDYVALYYSQMTYEQEKTYRINCESYEKVGWDELMPCT